MKTKKEIETVLPLVVAKKKPARTAKKPKPANATRGPRNPRKGSDSKKAIVLDLMRRKHGATTAEIAKVTDWQNHSIRGFVSGHVGKKMGVKVESFKNAAGERAYRI